MNEVIQAQHHIRLITDDKIPNAKATLFLKTVEKVGPDNIINSMQVYDKVGGIVEVMLRHYQDYNGDHVYEVPLKRNLEITECEKIIFVWDKLFKDEDFIIETSTPYTKTGIPEKEDDIISRDKFAEMCEKLSKEKHNRWLQARIDKGWRFATRFSNKDKTHPMLRDWDSLPSEYKQVDKQSPSLFLDMLDEFGFTVLKEK